MAHFAELDENNVVLRVCVIENAVIRGLTGEEEEDLGVEFFRNLHGNETAVWKQCSYNHNMRGRFPDKGWTYNETDDKFYPVKPYPSWVWNDEAYRWDSPLGTPFEDNNDERTTWDEDSQSWV